MSDLDARVAHLERQVSDLLDLTTANFGRLYEFRFSGAAYSQFTKDLTEAQQKTVLAAFRARHLTVIFPSCSQDGAPKIMKQERTNTMAKTDTPTLPSANELNSAKETWRAGMSRLRPLLQLEEVLDLCIAAAAGRDMYQKAADAARDERDRLAQENAQALTAHQREREQMKVDLEAERKDLAREVAGLSNEREVLKGELGELVAKRDEGQRVVESMRAKFTS